MTFGALAIILMSGSGCVGNQSRYVLTVRPSADVLVRELQCWSGSRDTLGRWAYADFDSLELAGLEAVHASHRTAELGRVHVFTDTLRPGLPRTSQGHASYESSSNSLGTASIYAERLRLGDPKGLDTDDMIRQARWLDRAVDLHVGWFAQRFRNHPDGPRLRDRLGTQFRQDLQGLGLGLLISFARPGEEVWPRATQYLAERGYVGWKVTELDLQGVSNLGTDELIFDLMVAFLHKELKVGGKLPPTRIETFLDAVRKDRPTLETYVESSSAYRELIRGHRRLMRPDAEAPAPSELLEPFDAKFVMERMGGLFVDSRRAILQEVVLELPCPPVRTNGVWRDTQRSLVWTDPDSVQLGHPDLWYAAWAIPNTAFQRRHFGGVRLEGEGLWTYCLWRQELSGGLAGQWERMLDRLTPETWEQEVDSFRFSPGTAGSDGTADDPASIPRELLLGPSRSHGKSVEPR